MLHTEFDFTLDGIKETSPAFLIPLILHTLRVGNMISQAVLMVFLNTDSSPVAQVTGKMRCISKKKHMFPDLKNDIEVAIVIDSSPMKSICNEASCKLAARCPIPAILADRGKLQELPDDIRKRLNL